MAIQISISGLTAQQGADVKDAFDETIARTSSLDVALTEAQWVERCLIRFVKSVVKGWKRRGHDITLAAEQAQVDIDYPEA